MIAFPLFAAAIVLAGAAPPQGTPPREAPDGWVLDFVAQKCVASRNYGSEEAPLLLILKPSPLGGVMQLSVVRNADKRGLGEAGVEVRIGDAPAITAKALVFDSKAKLRSLRLNLPIEKTAPLKQARTLSIRSKGELDESFSLGPMSTLMIEMDRCLVKLRQLWNIEEAGEPKLRTRAQGNLARFIKPEDYPMPAVLRSQGGTVKFALLVDETGKVADCTVTSTSGVPMLDVQSCEVLRRRAKFDPAVGLDGKPAKDAVTNNITWRIED